jgi:hypothetical protein
MLKNVNGGSSMALDMARDYLAVAASSVSVFRRRRRRRHF